MDDLDRAIVSLLSQDARLSLAVLSRRLKVARSTLQARLERLESNGTIAGYTLRLGPGGRAVQIRASVLLSIEPRALAPLLSRLRAIPEVERVNTTSGRVDLLVLVRAPSTELLDAALDQIGNIPGVKSSESLIHLSTRLDRSTES
ncbi:MAG: Lrp/AsnC family transcriptional regulator [Paracoccus sp. (in: a-proteobacteria)]|uniref:Lrp/AsnC family transcriptional regulator n=1 Tax=Paracoccus sp. TaxID=267 RepID=UPI0026E0E1E2|nr:Lrp/AsnC family transcriptional regulator [Paracoccus sp. (in: a-proteobacteria)]MDO5621397.1 Lrp/AsnC family transcriptional regulator [Paracoccus sp. (in: a-proteobacteria)]